MVTKRAEPADRNLLLDYGVHGMARQVFDVGRSLERLDRNGFLDAKRDSGGWTIRLGPRLRGWLA